MKRAVVTGGAGFLGFHLCASLLADGYGVVCIDDLSSGSRQNVADLHRLGGPRFTFKEGDVSDPDTLDARYSHLDVVYHFASLASPPAYQRRALHTLRTGFQGADNAAWLAARYGARLVFASTSEVYGSPKEHPQREEYWGHVNPIGPRSMYDEAKRAGEALLMAYRWENPDFDLRIARIFNTYGPRMAADDGRLIPNFITQALEGRPLTIFGDGSQTRSLCYVSDLIAGIRLLAEAPRAELRYPPVYNVGNPDERTVQELADVVQRVVGNAALVQYLPLPGDDPPRRCPSIYHLVMLGWGPEIDLEVGLSRTVDWFKEQAR